MRCSTCDAPLHFPSETKTGSCYDCQAEELRDYRTDQEQERAERGSRGSGIVIDVLLGVGIVGWIVSRLLA